MERHKDTREGILGAARVVIENSKGSYKSFGTEGDPEWGKYPLKGVTYPTEYGYIEGYRGEDGAELDVFVGTGDLYEFIRVWRLDVPIETKLFAQVTQSEIDAIGDTFRPVLRESVVMPKNECLDFMQIFKVTGEAVA